MYAPTIIAGFSNCEVLTFHIIVGLIIISLSIIPFILRNNLKTLTNTSKLIKTISFINATVLTALMHAVQLLAAPRVSDEFNKFYFANNLYLVVISLAFAIGFLGSTYLTKKDLNKSLLITRIILAIAAVLLIVVGSAVIIVKTLECIV